MTEKNQNTLAMTGPENIPCFVIRFSPGCYYVIPIFAIEKASDLPARLPQICRIAVVKPDPGEDAASAAAELMFQAMQSESRFMQRDNWLVLQEDLCYYFRHPSGKIEESAEIPKSSLWMPDSFFLNSTAGTPDKRDRRVFDAVRLRIYCNSLNDVGVDIIKHVGEQGFVPSLISFRRPGTASLPVDQPNVSWNKNYSHFSNHENT